MGIPGSVTGGRDVWVEVVGQHLRLLVECRLRVLTSFLQMGLLVEPQRKTCGPAGCSGEGQLAGGGGTERAQWAGGVSHSAVGAESGMWGLCWDTCLNVLPFSFLFLTNNTLWFFFCHPLSPPPPPCFFLLSLYSSFWALLFYFYLFLILFSLFTHGNLF